MRPLAVFALVVSISLLSLPLMCSASESKTTVMFLSEERLDVEKGQNQRVNISIYSSEERTLKLFLFTDHNEYFSFSETSFHIDANDWVYVQMLVSIPANATEASFDPVLLLSYFDKETGEWHDADTKEFTLTITGRGDSDTPSYLLPVLFILFLILEIAGIAFLLWTRARRYKDFEIRDLFLIYKDGRLIKHIATHSGASLDHVAVSSMFTAISNFIDDSFRSTEEPGRYGELKHGNVKVLVEHGDDIDLATVISGEYPPKFKRLMESTVMGIEEDYELDDWDGDYARFEGINDHLMPLLLMQRKKREHPATAREAQALTRLESERKKRAEEMARRLIESKVIDKDDKDDLVALVCSLDEPQITAFDGLMTKIKEKHVLRGKKVLYVPVPTAGGRQHKVPTMHKKHNI